MPGYPIRKRSGSAICSRPTVGRSARPGSRIARPVPSIGCVPIRSRRGSRLHWRGRMAAPVATDSVLGYPAVKINASECPSTSLGVGPMEEHQLVELATDQLRRRRPEAPGGDAVLQQVSSGENPGENMERHELRQGITKAIDALPPDLKTVVLLREFEGLSYAEIARGIRRPVGTVMSRLFHARRRLQASLGVYWEGES